MRPKEMTRGEVSGDQQVLVTVEINNADGHPHPVDVVMDTGFTGYLALPADTIQQLGLSWVGRRTLELANGELLEFEAYLAVISWHEYLTDVLVLRTDDVSLLGLSLLWGSRITLDVTTQGEVSVEDLKEQSSEVEPNVPTTAPGPLRRLWGSINRRLRDAAFVIALLAAIVAFVFGVDSLPLSFGEIITFMGIWLALGVILGQNKRQGTPIVPYLGRRIVSFACTYIAFTAIIVVYTIRKNAGETEDITEGEVLGLLMLSLLSFAVGFFAGQDKDPK